jgi:hypothetical protein
MSAEPYPPREPSPRRPPPFDDPLAARIPWTPLAKGGANFVTSKLVQRHPWRMEVRHSTGCLFVSLILIGFGVLSLPLAVLSLFQPSIFPIRQPDGTPHSALALFVPLAISLLFILAGVLILVISRIPFVFDQRLGLYWRGRGNPDDLARHAPYRISGRLKNIRALQIVGEWIGDSDNPYWSYELNLVLHDGSRINVMDHGSLQVLRRQASELAAFLRVPLWDGTQIDWQR